MTGTTKPKPAPLYEQVKDYILARIANGTWADGARVPSENDLVENLGFSRMTVHRALRELSADGLLSRIPGVGTFVAAPTPRSDLLEIRDNAEDIIARGHRHRACVVRLESVRADLSLATTFELRPGGTSLPFHRRS
ncbi:MAG TPA: GntR family transcriptional regulator [Rhodanobacter sp.]|nr:GntR family transcriptional regulator [Rhodanobacter sp.]